MALLDRMNCSLVVKWAHLSDAEMPCLIWHMDSTHRGFISETEAQEAPVPMKYPIPADQGKAFINVTDVRQILTRVLPSSDGNCGD